MISSCLSILSEDYVLSTSIDGSKDAVDELGSYGVDDYHFGFFPAGNRFFDFSVEVRFQFFIRLNGRGSRATGAPLLSKVLIRLLAKWLVFAVRRAVLPRILVPETCLKGATPQ